MHMQPVLSIVVAAHREGLIAHKTMRSIECATEKLRDREIPYEIIVTIDNGDAETETYFARYNNHPHTSVHSVKFGDLALSRNYGISQAKGGLIATVDADDLVSENWFVDGISFLNQLPDPVVLHTQYSINFGTQDVVWEKFDSRDKDEDAVIMAWANRWDSALIAPRTVFKQFPYHPNIEGYGSEDWHFNSETLAAGIPHKVVPKSVLFVRRKDVSLMTQQAAGRRTVRYTELLSFDYLRTIDPSRFDGNDTSDPNTPYRSTLQKMKLSTKKQLLNLHRKAKHGSTLYAKSTGRIVKPLKATLEAVKAPQSSRFPSWLMKEWQSMHLKEKMIFPDADLVKTVPLYHSEMYELGVILCHLAQSLTGKPTYGIFLPHLTNGGAELLALRYVKAVKKLHPDWHVAVIATEIGDNTWKNRLSADIDFVDFGKHTHHLPEHLRLQIMARFVVQSGMSRIHIAQSPLMFRFAELYKELLNPLNVYAFAFCEDKDDQGRIAGHIHSGLPLAYRAIDRVITDNNAVVRQLEAEYGYSDGKFSTHYQPVEYISAPPKPAVDKQNVRLLWAGRIAKQKRPDILVEISKALPSSMKIDVYGSFQDGYGIDLFTEVDSISYRGAFNGLESIPTEDYDLLVYTSENDGIPNILLEASSLGLPIVASSAGGIPEFINESTGRLVSDIRDVKAYIAAIEEIVTDDKLRKSLVKNAQKLLQTQHSSEQFYEAVRNDIT